MISHNQAIIGFTIIKAGTRMKKQVQVSNKIVVLPEHEVADEVNVQIFSSQTSLTKSFCGALSVLHQLLIRP